jgi:hypothetical protein
VARVKERLGRDAPHGHADATDAIALDERDAGAFGRGIEGRDVAAGATTEDRDVVPLLAHLVE